MYNFRIPLGALYVGTLFAAPQISFDLANISTRSAPQSLAVGDFNRDGKPDLAITATDSANNGTLEMLLGNGDGAFRSASVQSVGLHATRIVAADFNHDGKLDVAISVGDIGQVVVLLGNGDGSFQAPVDTGARTPAGQLAPGVPGLAVGDVNGDGKPDLVLGPYTLAANCSVAVLPGNGDGTFQAAVNSTFDRVDTSHLVVGDLNGDGKADVFVTGYALGIGQRFGRLLGNADASLSLTWSKDTYPFNFGTLLLIQDVNGNGKPDVVAVNYLDYPDQGQLSMVAFLDGSLSETYAGNARIQTDSGAGWIATSLAAADVDGDGHVDLLVSDKHGTLLVIPGLGDGTFQGPPTLPAPTPSPTIFTGARIPYAYDAWGSLATADVRDTGKPDIVLALSGQAVSLLKNGAGAPPIVGTSGVTNAATLAPAPAVPGSLMAIFGDGFSYGAGTVPPLPPWAAPFTAFGLTIQVNGLDAPLLYASQKQANVQIPWEVRGQTQATVLMTRNGASQSVTIPIATFAPGLFARNGEGTGQAAALIANTSLLAAVGGAFPNARPIHRGEYLSLYATGLGEAHQWGSTNTVGACCGGTTDTLPVVTIGNTPATVQYSGLAPGMVGVYQINVLIPDGAPSGDSVPVTLSIGGVAGNTVTIAIQ